MHDDNPWRTCGVAGHLRDMTLEQIRKLDPCYAKKFGEAFRGKVQVPTLYELLELIKSKKPELKQAYGARTMGYPDFQMQEFCGYDDYDEIGLSMAVARSEVAGIYLSKGKPVHMYCADTEEEVTFCIENGADLITANDPTALLKLLQERK